MAATDALPQAQVLPTLLTSRPKLSFVGLGLTKECSKARPEEAPCEDVADVQEEAEQVQKLPQAYTMSICVRNTFIDTPDELSPSLGCFYRKREVSTCPSAHIGRFSRLFQEADGSGWGSDDDADTQLPSEAQEPRGASEASPFNAASGGLGNVISLLEALSPPSQPLPAPEWDCQFGSAFASSAVVAPEVPYESAFGDCYFSWGAVDALPAECAATDGFFVQVPCDGVFNDWCSSWCEVPPQQGVVLDRCCVEGHHAEELPAARGMTPLAVAGVGAAAISAPPPPAQPAPGIADLPFVGSAAHMPPPPSSPAAAAGAPPSAVSAPPPAQPAPGVADLPGCGSAAHVPPPPAAAAMPALADSAPPPPARPAPGSADLPSAGSAAHAAGGCKPCAFFHTVGCESGPTCQFCHLCGPEERKLRRKAKMEARRADRRRRAAAGSEEDAEEA